MNPVLYNPIKITDFYFKTVLYEILKHFTENWSTAICNDLNRKQCSIGGKDYENVYNNVKSKLFNDKNVFITLGFKVFNHFKTDLINCISKRLIKDKSNAFEDIEKLVSPQIIKKKKNIQIQSDKHKSHCLNYFKYSF